MSLFCVRVFIFHFPSAVKKREKNAQGSEKPFACDSSSGLSMIPLKS